MALSGDLFFLELFRNIFGPAEKKYDDSNMPSAPIMYAYLLRNFDNDFCWFLKSIGMINHARSGNQPRNKIHETLEWSQIRENHRKWRHKFLHLFVLFLTLAIWTHFLPSIKIWLSFAPKMIEINQKYSQNWFTLANQISLPIVWSIIIKGIGKWHTVLISGGSGSEFFGFGFDFADWLRVWV